MKGEIALYKKKNLTEIDDPTVDVPISFINKGDTPLRIAICQGNLEVLQTLVDAGASLDRVTDDGFTPLQTTAQHASGAQVRVLIEAGADVESYNPQRYKPLHLAVMKCNESSVLALLDAGADVNAMGGANDKTPLIYASEDNVIEGDRVALIPTLVRYGAVVDKLGGPGCTALTATTENNAPRAVRALIDHGANINAIGMDGNTLLHGAAIEGFLEVAQVLIAAKAKLDVINTENSCAPLHLAANFGHTAIVQALVNAGASLELETSKVGTSLLIAMAKGHKATARVLTQAGIRLDEEDL